MNSKEDPTLIEVWEMKEQVQIDYKTSKYNSFKDFIENDVKEIKTEYQIHYRKKNARQLMKV